MAHRLPKLDDVSGPIVAAFLADEPPLTRGGRRGEAEHAMRLAAKLQERRRGKVDMEFKIVDLTEPHTPEDVAAALEIVRDSDAVFVLDVPVCPVNQVEHGADTPGTTPPAPAADGTARGGVGVARHGDRPSPRNLPLGCDDMGCY